MERETSGGAHWEDTPGRAISARAEGALARFPQDTPSGSEATRGIGDIFSAKATSKQRNPLKISGRGAVYGPRGGSIRKKIIGHGMRSVLAGLGGGKYLGRPCGALALLHQPSRQHGGGVFLHPLIDQSANFLTEIGGVGQTRQFKALQGVPGSGEKELPRRLRRAGRRRASGKLNATYIP